MGSDEPVTDTDPEPAGPLGVGESITKQGNELALDESEGEQQADRAGARANASSPERERDRLQGSVDPTRPGPDPAD